MIYVQDFCSNFITCISLTLGVVSESTKGVKEGSLLWLASFKDGWEGYVDSTKVHKAVKISPKECNGN